MSTLLNSELEKVYTIIYKHTNIPKEKIDPHKDFRSEIGLDSLQLVGIAADIEIALGIELPISGYAYKKKQFQ